MVDPKTRKDRITYNHHLLVKGISELSRLLLQAYVVRSETEHPKRQPRRNKLRNSPQKGISDQVTQAQRTEMKCTEHPMTIISAISEVSYTKNEYTSTVHLDCREFR